MVEITDNSGTTYDYGLSRMGVQIKTSVEDEWYDLELTNLVTINPKNDQEPYDGLENHNAGYVFRPQRFGFTISLPINSPSYRYLRKLLLNRYQFMLRVVEDTSKKPYNKNIKEYQGLIEQLSGCIFDDLVENIRVGEQAIATFNGQALRFEPIENQDDWNNRSPSKSYGSNVFDENTSTVDDVQ